MGFGMTTVLLNLHNAGLFELGAGILAMGIFYGGMAQVIAGIMEFKKGNTFGTTAFTSYGLFWLTVVFLVYFNGQFGIPKNSEAFMTAYLFMWGVFWMLAARDGFGWKGTWAVMTGWEGVLCGSLAIYCAMGQVLNESFGRTVLPLGAK
jgi:succinate-acetate transporter protein